MIFGDENLVIICWFMAILTLPSTGRQMQVRNVQGDDFNRYHYISETLHHARQGHYGRLIGTCIRALANGATSSDHE